MSLKKGLILGVVCYNSYMSDRDELEFIRRCLKQDKAAWDEFVDRYSRLIYNYIYSVFRIKGINPSSETIDDLFQEIFFGLIKDDFRKLRQFKGRNNTRLASWLRIITINFCLDHLKKKKETGISLDEDLDEQGFTLKDILADPHILANQAIADQEKLQYLSECIDSLGNEDRCFLEMHIYQGMELGDLQIILGVSRSAVDMRKSRVIQRLRDCFRDRGFQLEF